jgi:endonuclease/exonuclease/phosphatase family metal-dependent hydrolase
VPAPAFDLLTWNVAGRVRAVAEQAAALAELPVDVVALQEVRATAAAAWEDALAALGYTAQALTLPAARAAADPVRRLGVLTAARHPLHAEPPLDLPWPERHLAATVRTPAGPVRVHNLHAPISSKADLVKVRTLEAIAAHLAAPANVPVVLVGDLNTPQYESREGETRSFARTRGGRIRPHLGERHDAAELGVVPGLSDHGFADAFRAVHGYAARDRSWLYPNGKMGYRLDHVLVRGLTPVGARYVHPWREQRLSDHSALWARLESQAGFTGARAGDV